MIRILKPGMFATSVRCSRNLWPSAPRVLLPAAACPWRVLLWKLDQSYLLPATGEEGGSGVIGYHWLSLVFQMSIRQECFIDILSLQARMEVVY